MAVAARPNKGIVRPEGMDTLFLPLNPANLRSNARLNVQAVDSDVYNVCERLRELNDRLYVNTIDDDHDKSRTFVIMEETPTGSQVVFRTRKLDARVVEHVRYLLHVPFAERFAAAERLMDKWEAEDKENELDKMAEEMGLEMQYDLKRLGFTDGTYYPGSHARRRFGAK